MEFSNWLHGVKTDLDMICYLAECTLATVDDMSHRARVVKSEYARQQSIAQKAIEWLGNREPSKDFPRLRLVVRVYNSSVAAWAQTERFRFLCRDENNAKNSKKKSAR